eukprot:scaffold11.g3841.t1
MALFDVKVVLLGDRACGKSCVLHRYVTGRWQRGLPPTYAAGFGARRLPVDAEGVDAASAVVALWDTSGAAQFRGISQQFIRGADAALVVFDETRRSSWETARMLALDAQQRQPGIKVYLVGAKADLVERPEQAQGEEAERRERDSAKGTTAADSSGSSAPHNEAGPSSPATPFAMAARRLASAAADWECASPSAQRGQHQWRQQERGSPDRRPPLGRRVSFELSPAPPSERQQQRPEAEQAQAAPAPALLPREFSWLEATRFAASIKAPLVEVSAKTGEGVANLFQSVAEDVMQLKAASKGGAAPPAPRPAAPRTPPSRLRLPSVPAAGRRRAGARILPQAPASAAAWPTAVGARDGRGVQQAAGAAGACEREALHREGQAEQRDVEREYSIADSEFWGQQWDGHAGGEDAEPAAPQQGRAGGAPAPRGARRAGTCVAM